ncbi:hypothetical protein KBD33_02045 [Candidatus Gracilibacteria bacterium]|nr:hypothetical protein [Candidatus Gracilibacteria bacterium]
MTPFPNNPHYTRLVKSIRNEGLGGQSDQHQELRANIQGISLTDYALLKNEFPFLTDEELSIVISKIIAWYHAVEVVRKASAKI